MKVMKSIAALAGISIIYCIFWMVGISIGGKIFPSTILQPTADANTILLRMLLACIINSAVIFYTISASSWRGAKLFWTLVLQIYAIQFFLSQIETFWFNSALQLPHNLIYSMLVGGLLTALVVSFFAMLFTGRWRRQQTEKIVYLPQNPQRTIIRVLLLVIIIYPMLYFIAGYFIAWQFEAVRVHYTHSADIASFWFMLWQNTKSGLWAWQIFRGLLWIAVALPVLKMAKKGFPQSGFIVGLLFAILMNAQHLIPNPYMPGIIPLAHAIETASSNFIWGFFVAWLLTPQQQKISE